VTVKNMMKQLITYSGKKRYSVMGSSPGDGDLVDAHSPKEAVIKFIAETWGAKKKNIIGDFKKHRIVGKRVGRSIYYSDYKVTPVMVDEKNRVNVEAFIR
jgi:hypothetical protein